MGDLFTERATLKLPKLTSVFGSILKNPVVKIGRSAETVEVDIEPLRVQGIAGYRVVLSDGFSIAFVDKETAAKCNTDAVIQVANAKNPDEIARSLLESGGEWLAPRKIRPNTLSLNDAAKVTAETAQQWRNQFTIVPEQVDEATIRRPGLRSPQVGAMYAALAHWSVSSHPATIVMPTGTGKTEVMLALLVATSISRLLVVVPNGPLRHQIAEKFSTLGILKDTKCLQPNAPLPSVTLLKHIPKTPHEVDEIFLRSNVIVTTMQVAGNASPEVQARMAELVSDLFVDEAHHIGARTWAAFKAQFKKRRILQFTATPFRNDGRRVDGKFIYVYPLWKAQEEKFFKPINFIPIQGIDASDTDEKIIDELGKSLSKDKNNGFEHLAMARASDINRATYLHKKYKEKFPEHSPLLLNSRLPPAEREVAIKKLKAKESRIVVCVDMLGEGFDLPDLKIAALHDKHKSEAVTLQFVGRFTRTRSDLGDATVIANLANDDVKESLRSLYAEDADWNRILNVIGTSRTEKEVRREEVFQGFSTQPERFPLETLFPRMSTIVYKTTCDAWKPNAVESANLSGKIVDDVYVNEAERLTIFVTRDEEYLRWSTVKEPVNVEYNLFMLHWDDEHGLLYINSSRLSDLHLPVAKAVAGEDVERLGGEAIFRVLDGFRRLVLMNLGLSETQRKPVRYSMFMGSDIAEQLETLPGNRNRTKTNIFGQGYTDIGKATIGCSVKGKVWSYESTNNFGQWIEWCKDIGRKLLDPTITTENILRKLVRPKKQDTRPAKPPIAIAWPERFLHLSEDKVDIVINSEVIPFYDCEIEITDYSDDGPIKFKVGSDTTFASFEMTINSSGAHYTQVAGKDVLVNIRKKTKTLIDVFKEDPPHIYFADGDMLVDSELFMLPRDGERAAYDLNKIETLDWSKTDIQKESQGPSKDADSIQRLIIERLLPEDLGYDVVYDDDASGEVADVVAIRQSGQKLIVDLFHCKYAEDEKPRGQVADLYEVCGQAQKCIRWREKPDIFLKHLQKRHADRIRSTGSSRYEKGNPAILNGWINRWREFSYEFSVTIVHPGYSKAKAKPEHLELFAATESLLMDTWGMKFRALVSD